MRVAGQVTQEALSAITDAEKLFFLVQDAVSREWLKTLNPTAETLYDSYREGRDRSETYAEMVERILAPVRAGREVVVAFYGHPGVFVNPAQDAIRIAREEGHYAEMYPGISAEDALFADLGLDPGPRGCQSFEATDFLIRNRRFDPTTPLLLWQVGGIGVRDFREDPLWSARGLELLVEELVKSYPADHEVVVYEASPFPVCPPKALGVPLSELARAPVTIVSTLYVPPLPNRPVDRALLAALGVEPPPPAPARRSRR